MGSYDRDADGAQALIARTREFTDVTRVSPVVTLDSTMHIKVLVIGGGMHPNRQLYKWLGDAPQEGKGVCRANNRPLPILRISVRATSL